MRLAMEQTLEYLYRYGYIIIFLYSLGGGFVALLAGSVVAYTEQMNITIVILAASLGNFIGSQFFFWFARKQKRELAQTLQKHRRKIALVRCWIGRYGTAVIFIQKYIYAIKTFVPIVMGLSQYKSWRFGIYNFLASFVWGISVGVSAFLLGRVFVDSFYAFQDNPYLFPLFGIALLVGLYALITYLANKRRKK